MSSVLEFDSVELSFGERRILSGIYMRCQQGEVVGLLGRNGCGKSSLMRAVFGVLEPGHQSVRIDGVSLQGDYLASRQIAYLPQGNLIPSYVELHKAFSLFKVDVELIYSVFPEAREFSRYKPGQLSGGWQRMLETLLILHSPATFCFLDEPFTGLMPIHIETMKQHIANIKTKGIIISDHMHRHVTEVANRIYLLTNGRTIEIHRREQLVQYGYLNDV